MPPAPPPRRRKPVRLPPARRSAKLLVRIAPAQVALFRFLLEAHDNLALFTVLHSRTANRPGDPSLLKLLFSPHQERDVRAALDAMRGAVPFDVAEWPLQDGDEG